MQATLTSLPTKQISRNTQLTAKCPECYGRGGFGNGDNDRLDCGTCKGTGEIVSEYAAGYRVRLTCAASLVIVINPAGVEYLVDRKNKECGCPATVERRHLRNIELLMREQADQMAYEANALIMQADERKTYTLTRWGVTSGYEGFAADMVARANDLYRQSSAVRNAIFGGN
jgi:hypothetical protein